MLTGPYFKPFLQTLNLSKYSFALPFRWIESRRRLVLVESKLYNFMTLLGLGTGFAYSAVLIHQLFLDLTPAVVMILIMWLTINLIATLTKLAVMQRKASVRDFFNCTIAFEDKYFGGKDAKNKKSDFAVLLVLKLTYLSVAVLPLAVSGYIGLKPCTRPFITSYILRCTNESELNGSLQIARIVLAVTEGMFLFHIVGMSAFVICFLLYLSQGCLKTYLTDLGKTSTVTSSPDNLNGLNPIVYNQAMIYRQLQTLHNRLHSILRAEILPTAQTSWTIITITSLYTTIKLHDVIGFPLFLFFPTCAIDGIVFFYVVIGASSQCYLESYDFLHVKWGRRLTALKSRSTTRWFLRFRRSCQELRTYVGTIGFLDKTTPVAIIHFCLAQTGGLILLGY